MQSYIIVDDIDPAIEYINGWEAGPVAAFPTQYFFNNTFHQLSASSINAIAGASLLFIFNGTDIIVGGAVVLKDNEPFTPQCAIDGTPVSLSSASSRAGILCEEHGLSVGAHTIVIAYVNESNSTSQSQLWVDYIQYIPSAGTPPDGGNLFMPVDVSMSSVPDWTSIKNDTPALPGVQTNINGAGIDINSTGNAITWFGCPSDTLSHLPPANVVYTIDGISTQTIANNTLILFDNNLEYGTHQIHVEYGGTSDEMPLTFCGYAVASTPSASFPSNTNVAHHLRPTTEVGVILGATAVGGALLFLLRITIQWYKQQRKRRHTKLQSEECGRA